LAAILVGSRDHQPQFWKGATQGSFHQSLVAIGSDLASTRHFRHWRLIFESDECFPYPIRHLNFQKIVEKCL
jgi:hypothetical protein